MSYRTGLQFVNQTSMPIVSGRIEYNSNDFGDNGIASFFTAPTTSVQGSDVSCYGPMNIQPGRWADEYIEIYATKGYDPITVELTFSNGHWIRFDDLQRRAYDTVSADHPLPVKVDQPAGAGVTDRMGVAYWTRHDADIRKVYEYGLVTYVIGDHSLTASWMETLDQQRKISEITLPGTHDSGTWTLTGNAQCQTRDIRQQLDSGIRFIDIRLELLLPMPIATGGGSQPPAPGRYGDLEIYHGLKATGLFFHADVVSACQSFLAQHPSETIIMMISRNRVPGEVAIEKAAGMTAASEAEFKDNVDYLIADPIFRRGTTIPTVLDAKGHIVLVTRYPGGPGIPVEAGWPDDAEGRFTEAGNGFYVQDVYGFGFPDGIDPAKQREKLDKKWSFIEGNLVNAPLSGRQQKLWWFNYSSASGFPVLDPVDFAHGIAGATGMNDRLLSYLKSHPRGYYGTVPMDFPDAELIQRLIAANG